MSGVSGKCVVLGVSGSIAAYKAADIASKLNQAGIRVYTAMTPSACRFVGPLTFHSLTGNPVASDLFGRETGSHAEHVDWARRADLILIAPATATTIARLARGLADEPVSAIALAATVPVMVAPAMNPGMWGNPAVRENVDILKRRGITIIGPAAGNTACGEEGTGRLAEPGEIVVRVLRKLAQGSSWKGRRVLVTAGPTREYLDSVRFITNASSGKMGFALARAALSRGADVTLIAGPTELAAPFGVKEIRVGTGNEMRRAVLTHFKNAELLLKTAAVTDYAPAAAEEGKNTRGEWEVKLKKLENILEALPRKRKGQVAVGFAAEIGDPERNARVKLKRRGLDLVVANDVSVPGSGFGADNNLAVLVRPVGKAVRLPLLSKDELAETILDAVEPLMRGGKNNIS